MKILVVDDVLSDRMYLMARLIRLGHEVVAAADGMEALAIFARFAPDLVLLDVVMPVMDGLETASRIRALGDDGGTWVPIIFLSQRNSDEDIALGIEAGGDDYLIKPVSDIVLMAKMRAMQRIAAMRARQAELTASLTRANEKLLRIAEIDGLTGLPNRRRFDAELAREWKSCARFRQPLSALMVGADHLREINEHHGHLAGDDYLKQVARFLEREINSPPDVLARHGGGKFCILLPDIQAGDMLAFAHRLHQGTSSLSRRMSAVTPDALLTLSVGVAGGRVPEAGGSPTELLSEAEEILRRAKRAGGNRVVTGT